MKKDKKVICNGDRNWHQCEKRKCPHRKQHKAVKGRCDKKVKSWEGHCWCIAPGTSSLQHIGEDGGLVTCLTIKEIEKEKKEFNEYKNSFKRYYILSLSRTNPEMLVWWKKDSSGYTINLSEAGQYTHEQVRGNPEYFDNNKGAKAVLCQIAEKMSIKCVTNSIGMSELEE